MLPAAENLSIVETFYCHPLPIVLRFSADPIVKVDQSDRAVLFTTPN